MAVRKRGTESPGRAKDWNQGLGRRGHNEGTGRSPTHLKESHGARLERWVGMGLGTDWNFPQGELEI